MTFYEKLDTIMRHDFGARGLLPALPPNPLREADCALSSVKRAILLTGFPVRMADGSFAGETDGPSGTANLAAALIQTGCQVHVVTDAPSFQLLEAALSYRAPEALLHLLPACQTGTFVHNLFCQIQPTHFFSLERPGKAADGHYHNMRGQVIDDMLTDSAMFLSEARQSGAVTISVGDGGNEMGMGTYRKQIERFVPSGMAICAAEAADITLAGGVSNWWAWGIAALLSLRAGRSLLPSSADETELLRRVVAAGGVDGCTKENALTVDQLPLEAHLSILEEAAALLGETMEKEPNRPNRLPGAFRYRPANQLLPNRVSQSIA